MMSQIFRWLLYVIPDRGLVERRLNGSSAFGRALTRVAVRKNAGALVWNKLYFLTKIFDDRLSSQ